jgi:co-chaperonin GroES (HSP10)
MKAISRYIIVDKIKTEPKMVSGLIMTDETDQDNRYIKAKIISCGNLVEGLKDDYVVVTHTGIKHQVYMKALVQAINGNKDGFIIAADLTSQLGAGSEYGVTAFDAVITFAA